MAASTLHTLLYKLGFDVSGLASGGAQARAELAGVGAAAQRLASQAAPVAGTLNNIAAAENAAANAAPRLIAGMTGASGAIAAVGKTTGPLVTGLTGANGAMEAVNKSAGPLIAGITGANGAMQATTKSTGPLVTAQVAAAQAMTQTSRAAGPLVAGINSASGAISSANRATGPLVAGIQGMNGPMMVAGNSAQKLATNVQAVDSRLNMIPGPASRAAGAMNGVAMAADHVAQRATFMQRVLSMAFAFSGGVAITNLFAFVGNALVGFNSRLEQSRIAFTTLLGSTDMADAFIAKMEKFAEVTPFEFPGLQDAVQRLIAMGFAADDALPVLRAVGDAVAALGGSQDKLDRITIALGQMSTAGRVNAQDMRQLTEAGIPAWQMLATAIGKSVQETRDMAEKGVIPAGLAINALVSGMEERFGGMMAKQARTFQGAMSTIKDASLITISSAVRPLFDALAAGTVAIGDFFIGGGGKYVVPVIQAIGIALAVILIPRLYATAAAAAAASASIFGLTVPILPLIVTLAALGMAWQENFGGIRNIVEPVVSGLANALGGLVNALGGADSAARMLVVAVEALAVVITTRFIVSAIAAAGAMAMDAAAAFALGGAFTGLTLEATAASGSLLGVGAAAGVAGIGLAALALPIALIVGAVALLILNFDRVKIGAQVLAVFVLGAIASIVEGAASIPFIGDQFKGLATSLRAAQEELRKSALAADEALRKKEASNAGSSALDDIKTQIQSGSGDVINAAEDLVKKFGTSIEGIKAAAEKAGGDAMLKMAQGIRDAQNAPLDAFKNLHEMVRNQLSPMKEIARLYGMYTSQDLAVGLKSADPAVYAQAVATQKIITERLDAITNGAFSAGQNVTSNLAGGLSSSQAMGRLEDAMNAIGQPLAAFFDAMTGGQFGAVDFLRDSLNQMKANAAETERLANTWNNQYKPSVDSVRDAMKGVNDEMSRHSAASSAMESAFREIQQAAERYFDAVHRRTLDAIEDARKHKNAILDAKAALIQGPIDAAQRALDFQRRKLEEWRLREAVKNATTPAERRDAILALQDFLAQSHIDEMQAEADQAKGLYDQQKAANDRQAELQKAAENRRYERQKEDFERQLELLRRYLAKHPGEWQHVQGKIIALLHSYGFSYKKAGSMLGASFVDGLKEQVKAAQDAAKELADLIPPYTSQDPAGSGDGAHAGGGRKAASGEWRVLGDNLGYLLHKDEMVAPAGLANLLRELGSKPMGASPPGLPVAASRLGGGGPPTPSMWKIQAQRGLEKGSEGGAWAGRPIIFQVGDETLGEITDKSLAQQSKIYRPRRRVNTGSMR